MSWTNDTPRPDPVKGSGAKIHPTVLLDIRAQTGLRHVDMVQRILRLLSQDVRMTPPRVGACPQLRPLRGRPHRCPALQLLLRPSTSVPWSGNLSRRTS